MQSSRSVRLGQSEFRCSCHACAFFHSSDEEYELLLPFTRDAYRAGEHIFQVVDKAQRDERRRRLVDSGIDGETGGRCPEQGPRLRLGKPLPCAPVAVLLDPSLKYMGVGPPNSAGMFEGVQL